MITFAVAIISFWLGVVLTLKAASEEWADNFLLVCLVITIVFVVVMAIFGLLAISGGTAK